MENVVVLRAPVADTGTQLDLWRLRPGTVVEVASKGSLYWVTVSSVCKLRGNRLLGVSLTSNRTDFHPGTTSPADTAIDRYLQLGKPLRYGKKGITSEVKAFRVL